MKQKEREADELVLLTKRFIAFAERQYNNKEITAQEYEGLVCKKIAFLNAYENQVVYPCSNNFLQMKVN
jgi:hypothetical protein